MVLVAAEFTVPLASLGEKLKSEGEVDIFRAVKTIKMNRPELVENLVSITV